MPSLTLKNVPDDLMDALREAAAGDRRSMNQEILHLLISALGRRSEAPVVPGARVQDQLRAWRKLAGKWKSDLSPAEEARRLTRRRSGGRKADL